MRDRYIPVAERCEQQASLLKDEGRDEAATVLWEADALIRALEIENERLREDLNYMTIELIRSTGRSEHD